MLESDRAASTESPELSFVTKGSIFALLLLLVDFDLQLGVEKNLMKASTRKSTDNSQNSRIVRTENPIYNAKMAPRSDSNWSI